VGIPLRVTNLEVPTSTDASSWVTGSGIVAKSDGTGMVAFNLIRGALVQVSHPYRPDISLRRRVPDLAEIGLIDWLFPYVKEVLAWDPDAITIEVGGAYVPRYDALLSDNTTVLCPLENLTVESDDSAVASWSVSGICGVSPGGANLTVTGIDQGFLPTNQTSEGEVLEHVALPTPIFPDALAVLVS
jgi:hypothetical protein